jgi:hypothetical protein
MNEKVQPFMAALLKMAEKRMVASSNGFGPSESMVVVSHAYNLARTLKMGLPELMHIVEYLDEMGEVKHIEAHRVEGWHGNGLALVIPHPETVEVEDDSDDDLGEVSERPRAEIQDHP